MTSCVHDNTANLQGGPAKDRFVDVVAHHLRLFGIQGVGSSDSEAASPRLQLLARPDSEDIARARDWMSRGGIAVAMLPGADFCREFGLERSPASIPGPSVLAYDAAGDLPWRRLRTLFAAWAYAGAEAVVRNADGMAIWAWRPLEAGGLLVIGTDLTADLIRYRQGDVGAAAERKLHLLGGIANERPIYLYEKQLQGERPAERHADWWAMALAHCLSGRLRQPLPPMLPGGAVGALVLTGDDDQAQLANYRFQLELIGDLPMTYFLHPLTKHNARTLRAIARGGRTELGLHPDSLDAPSEYEHRFLAQARWFTALTGARPISVRNHGFLSDGYWGHFPVWDRAGVRISANIPGIDGRILNGSLLPSRLFLGDRLTDHWSLLTAIGDGIMFALGKSADEASECILRLGTDIRRSGVPGVIVLNLHPDNVGTTRSMHVAALELVKQGFHPWRLSECLQWFQGRDGSLGDAVEPRQSFWKRARRRIAQAAYGKMGS
jgi:hypothetical protein